MPFIEGESLRARLDRQKQLPIRDALDTIPAGERGPECGQGVGYRCRRTRGVKVGRPPWRLEHDAGTAAAQRLL